MASHNHAYRATIENGTQGSLTNDVVLGRSVGGSLYQSNTTNDLVPMDPQTVSETGGGGAHPNRQPLLGLNFIIALTGIFPSRN